MIPIEVGEPSTIRLLFQEQHNEEYMQVELETKDEVQEMAIIKEEAIKLQALRRLNANVQRRSLQPSDLIWQV